MFRKHLNCWEATCMRGGDSHRARQDTTELSGQVYFIGKIISCREVTLPVPYFKRETFGAVERRISKPKSLHANVLIQTPFGSREQPRDADLMILFPRPCALEPTLCG